MSKPNSSGSVSPTGQVWEDWPISLVTRRSSRPRVSPRSCTRPTGQGALRTGCGTGLGVPSVSSRARPDSCGLSICRDPSCRKITVPRRPTQWESLWPGWATRRGQGPGELTGTAVRSASRILRIPQRTVSWDEVLLARGYLERGEGRADEVAFTRAMYGHPFTFHSNTPVIQEWFCREAIGMWEWQRRATARMPLVEEVEVQVLAIGDVAIVAYPCELSPSTACAPSRSRRSERRLSASCPMGGSGMCRRSMLLTRGIRDTDGLSEPPTPGGRRHDGRSCPRNADRAGRREPPLRGRVP